MADAIVDMDNFIGVNNIDDPVSIAPEIIYTSRNAYKQHFYVVQALNLEIDNSLAFVSRAGSTQKISGTDCHSFFGCADCAFFVDGDVLYLVDKNYEKTALLSGLTTGARMSYVEVAGRVYMTNGSFIGYYADGSVTALAEPGMEFKKALPAGKIITYFHGRLIVARGRVLYLSDVLTNYYDTRSGFKVFEEDVSMVRPIDSGMYVSDDNTWFLSEVSDAENNFISMKKDKVLSERAVPFTDVLVDGQIVGENGEKGLRAIWTSAGGVYQGDGSGNVATISPKYLPSAHGNGAAALRDSSGVNHYIVTLD